MKTDYTRNLELALIIVIALSLLLLACDVVDNALCGSIWLDCHALTEPRELCDDCYLLSQRVEGDIRYFQFYDCADKETLQSSVSAACTLEGG